MDGWLYILLWVPEFVAVVTDRRMVLTDLMSDGRTVWFGLLFFLVDVVFSLFLFLFFLFLILSFLTFPGSAYVDD